MSSKITPRTIAHAVRNSTPHVEHPERPGESSGKRTRSKEEVENREGSEEAQAVGTFPVFLAKIDIL